MEACYDMKLTRWVSLPIIRSTTGTRSKVREQRTMCLKGRDLEPVLSPRPKLCEYRINLKP